MPSSLLISNSIQGVFQSSLKIIPAIRRYVGQGQLTSQEGYCTVLEQLPKRRNGRKIVKKDKQPSEDARLFQQEMEGVVPLKVQPTSDSKAPMGKLRGPEQLPAAGSIDRPYPPPAQPLASIHTDQGAQHHKDGIQKKTLQKLKRGQFPVRDQLDLHHMSVATGHRALLDFIANARRLGHRSVRIIHGKGRRSQSGPRLRTMTQEVLRQHPQVLAFTPCKPADGGDGATDVLLKSQ
jgi:DNA-nicking Smr family endonuclease